MKGLSFFELVRGARAQRLGCQFVGWSGWTRVFCVYAWVVSLCSGQDQQLCANLYIHLPHLYIHLPHTTHISTHTFIHTFATHNTYMYKHICHTQYINLYRDFQHTSNTCIHSFAHQFVRNSTYLYSYMCLTQYICWAQGRISR